MSTSLAVISQKGGVGKTTVAVNLCYSFVRRGWRVLLVDSDLQGGLGFSLTEKSKEARGFYDLLLEGEEAVSSQALSETILQTNLPELGLLTRGSRGAVDEILSDMGGEWAQPQRIASLSQAIATTDYEIVIFDTPTGLNRVSTGVAAVSDSLLIPQQSSPLCLRSLPQILRMVASVRSASGAEGSDGPRVAGFILSLTDPDDPGSLEDQGEFRDLLPQDMVLETVIPRHRDFVEASRIGVPVAMLRDRPSPSSLIFDQLAAELEPRLQLHEEEEYLSEDLNDYARLVD